MSNKIWVYIDHFEGKALPVSWEGIGAAKELFTSLGEGVTAVILGQGLEQLVQEAYQAGADEVLVGDDPGLADYRPEPFSSVLSRQAKESQPQVLLFPTTSRGRELAAMAAIDLSTGVMPEAIALEMDGDTVVVTRPVYAGKLLSKARCETRPQIITLRVRAFAAPEKDVARSGTPIRMDTSGIDGLVKSQVEGYVPADGGVSLTEAAVIVSGGRGVANNPSLTPPAGMDEKEAEIWKARQGFQLVSGLAQVLGGAVGASRAAVDAGYIPYAHQVGQTGKVVSPDLYIAAGISGAIQHLAGMRSSKTIVAVNKDPDAPIFKLARFGVVGDLHEILPHLTETLRLRLGK